MVAPITVPTGPATVPATAPPPAATTLLTNGAESFPARALVVASEAPFEARVLPMMAPPEDRARVSSGFFSKLTGTDFILYICDDQSRLSWTSDCWGGFTWVVLLSTSSDMLVSMLAMVSRYLAWISLMQARYADCSSELLISGLRTILSYFCVRNLSMS